MVEKKKVSLALFTASSYMCVHLESHTGVTKPVAPPTSCTRVEDNSSSIQHEMKRFSRKVPELTELSPILMWTFWITHAHTHTLKTHTHTYI